MFVSLARYLGIPVAQVVLENLCKSFPARPGDRQPATLAEPMLASSGALETHSKSAAPQAPVPAAQPDSAAQPSSGSGLNILSHINLTIADGEFMVLVGPSGCGKSTLLRLIAGLETPTSGSIWVGDRHVNDLPPKARDIAMVFQSYALYPHMTVYDNLAFGLRRTKLQGAGKPPSVAAQLSSTLARLLPKVLRAGSKQEQSVGQTVRRVAQMLELEALLERYPKQLSGGQKQRVALGRAMARDPQVFLMDEPLSNLDAKLRAQTRAQIVQLQRQLGTTTIYVTHDQTEAMTMGDRIAVLNGGEIQQIAAPLELYQSPANRFVAEFIGSPPMNFINAVVKEGPCLVHPHFSLTLPPVWTSSLAPYRGKEVTLGVRPEHFSVSARGPQSLPVEVALVEALGHETYLSCMLENEGKDRPYLQARTAPQQKFQYGDRIGLAIDPQQIHLFEAQSGVAIFPA
ncbi:ABC transporter ATP-binding protein [Altericista sp. CCNU0014]|uniref:ABC transporter ATP-binding protein n=1 Tax=Altericista sp. CCNU0014 TaxID=3082949 RepID=UPI00384E0379